MDRCSQNHEICHIERGARGVGGGRVISAGYAPDCWVFYYVIPFVLMLYSRTRHGPIHPRHTALRPWLVPASMLLGVRGDLCPTYHSTSNLPLSNLSPSRLPSEAYSTRLGCAPFTCLLFRCHNPPTLRNDIGESPSRGQLGRLERATYLSVLRCVSRLPCT